MGADSMKSSVITSVLIIVFAFICLSFLVYLTANYGISSDELNNGYYDFSAINSSVGSLQENSASLAQVFSQDDTSQTTFIESAFGGVGSFFGIIWDTFALIVLAINLIFIQSLLILGVPVIIISAIVGIILIAIIFGIYRLLKIGD